jgi:hypothetical protein
MSGARRNIPDQFCGMQPQRSRDIDQFDRIQTPLAGFITRDELLMGAKALRNVLLT